MNNKKPLPTPVIFAILTTITVFVWIGFEAYRALTKKPSPSVEAQIIEQLNPSLDTATLSSLVQRIHLEDSEIGETQNLNLSQPPRVTQAPTAQEAETQETTEEEEST